MRAFLRAMDAHLSALGIPCCAAGQAPPDLPLPLLTLAVEQAAPLATGRATVTLYAGDRQTLLPLMEALVGLFPPEGVVLRREGEAVAQVWPLGMTLNGDTHAPRRGAEASLSLAVRLC